MGTLKPHSASEIFPLMHGAEFDALVRDIEEHGQREPIILFEGQILDGRNRHRACAQLGLAPTFLEWRGEGTPEAFVVSMNLHRRHLNESQRGLIAARLANQRPPGRNPANSQGLSNARAAEILNVGERTVYEAKKVIRNGTQEEVQAVERGEAAVSSVANKIRKRAPPNGKDNSSHKPASENGSRVNVPEGLTLEQLCRQGLELEAKGSFSESVAAKLGIARATYSKMRDIVTLADRSELRPADRTIAQRALAEMNKTRRVVKAWEIIEPLTARLWGHRRGPRTNLEAMRLSQFDRALGAILQACSMAAEVEVPYLKTERAKEVFQELSEAEKSVRDFKNRIKEQCQ